jgi:hypothetical protein
MKKILFSFTVLLISTISFAQTTIAYLDINNVKAGFLNRGDFFWNPNTGKSAYEFPKGSGLHSNFTNAIWVAGKDSSNILHVSAQTYRQTGNDYWSGPLDNTNSVDTLTSFMWDKIWKINASTIDSFKQLSIHTITNTDPAIMEWPSKGNVFAKGNYGIPLAINKNMAPFVDANNDGLYNALDGDYPAIKGEQALWWVFNDNGPTHSLTNSIPFQFEFHAMAYACNQSPLKDVVFLNFKIINKSNTPYHDVRIGLFSDIDLGQYNNDYTSLL